MGEAGFYRFDDFLEQTGGFELSWQLGCQPSGAALPMSPGRVGCGTARVSSIPVRCVHNETAASQENREGNLL